MGLPPVLRRGFRAVASSLDVAAPTGYASRNGWRRTGAEQLRALRHTGPPRPHRGRRGRRFRQGGPHPGERRSPSLSPGPRLSGDSSRSTRAQRSGPAQGHLLPEIEPLSTVLQERLAKGNRHRSERARAKVKLKRGDMKPREVLTTVPAWAGTWTVEAFLVSLPGIWKNTAPGICEKMCIRPTRYLRDLSQRQRDNLLREVSRWR